MSRLTALGSGLLLGAGLGIIIPECVSSTHFSSTQSEPTYSRGVEAVIEASKLGASSGHGHFPATTIAVSLLVGFMFMLVTEQLIPGAHSHSVPHMHGSNWLSPKDSVIEFDVDLELGELENPTQSLHPTASTSTQCPTTHGTADGDRFRTPVLGKALNLTLGLVLHALSDGLALGSSIVSDSGSQELSLAVFAALVIHKGMATLGIYIMLDFITEWDTAPTALALTTSLLASGVNRTDCRKCLAIFSASTPSGAALTYLFLRLFHPADGGENHWTGIAMLVSVSCISTLMISG